MKYYLETTCEALGITFKKYTYCVFVRLPLADAQALVTLMVEADRWSAFCQYRRLGENYAEVCELTA